MKKKYKLNQIKLRDDNIKLSIQGEINMSTKIDKDKTKYSRKIKHQKLEDLICSEGDS